MIVYQSIHRPRFAVFLAAVASASLVVGACSGGEDPAESTPESVAVDPTGVSADTTDLADSEVRADVTASGVILAATLIAAGNIEEAVASGLVTPAEVDEARAAIEGGTLDRWVELAEGK